MSDEQRPKTPITERLQHWSYADSIVATSTPDRDGGTGSVANIPPEALKEAAGRILELEIAARAVRIRMDAGGITSHDAPSDAVLAALRDLAG